MGQMFYYVNQFRTQSFFIGLVKTKSDFLFLFPVWLQVFSINCRSSDSCLTKLLELLTGLGLLEPQHLVYPRLSTEFGMLVFFSNLGLMEFEVRYLVLFLLFSVIEFFESFWMGSLHKNIQLILEFRRVHSWSYTFPAIH